MSSNARWRRPSDVVIPTYRISRAAFIAYADKQDREFTTKDSLGRSDNGIPKLPPKIDWTDKPLFPTLMDLWGLAR